MLIDVYKIERDQIDCLSLSRFGVYIIKGDSSTKPPIIITLCCLCFLLQWYCLCLHELLTDTLRLFAGSYLDVALEDSLTLMAADAHYLPVIQQASLIQVRYAAASCRMAAHKLVLGSDDLITSVTLVQWTAIVTVSIPTHLGVLSVLVVVQPATFLQSVQE